MPDLDDLPVRYLKLRPEFETVDNGGNLQPLQTIGLTFDREVQTPLGPMIEQTPYDVPQAPALTDQLHVRIVPGTTIVETRLSRICDVLLNGGVGQFIEIDKPTKKELAEAAKETQPHSDYVKAYAEAVERGEEPATDIDDHVGAEPAPVAASQTELQARGRPDIDPAADTADITEPDASGANKE